MADPISLQTLQWQTLNQTDHLNQKIRALASESRTRSAPAPRLKEACAELESLFIYHLLKEMRATVLKTGLFSGGRAEEIYTSMMDLQMSRELSKSGGIGLSAILVDQLGGESRRGDVPATSNPPKKQ
jgi:flagellar protein FlgJ